MKVSSHKESSMTDESITMDQNPQWIKKAQEDLDEQSNDEFSLIKKRYQHTEFLFSNGLPGTYKTTAIIKTTDALTRKGIGSFHAVPSKFLCSEVQDRHQEECVVLNSDTIKGDETVGELLRMSLRKGTQKAYVVTHHAILNTEKLPITDYTLFWDELFDPTIHIEINLDEEMRETLQSLIEIENIDGRYAIIKAKNKTALWNTIYSMRNKNKEDDSEEGQSVNEKLLRLLTYVARFSHFDVYSHNTFNRNSLYNDGKKFVATIIVKPDIFYPWKSVRFSSAGFEYSLLYYLWNKKYGIDWKVDQFMMSQLREPKKRKIRVRYWSKMNGWSKSFNQKQVETSEKDIGTLDEFMDKTHLNQYYEDVDQLMDEGIRNVLIGKNKSDNHSLKQAKEEILPYGSEGRNSFTHHRAYVEAGAYNKSNSYYEFMDWLGLLKEAKICDAERVYQNLYRTGIRDENQDEVWTLIIPSKFLFPNYLYERFEVVEIEQFGNLKEKAPNKGGRPKGSNKVDPSLSGRRKYLYDAKAKAKKERKKQGIADDDSSIAMTLFGSPSIDDGEITAFPSYGDLHHFQRSDLYLFLMNESKKQIRVKTENLSFSLIEYKDNRRSSDNVLSVHGAVFDFDTVEEEGAITSERVKSILGDQEFFLYPSFSGGYKCRLVIPFQESLTPGEAYSLIKSIHHSFLNVFPKCKSDRKCFDFSQLWFLPRNNPGTLVSGKVFDGRKYLNHNVAWGLSEEQLERDNHIKNINGAIVQLDSDRAYERFIVPELSEIKPGTRFNVGQRLVGLCKKHCPEKKSSLFNEFKSRGVSKQHLMDLETLFYKKF